MLTSRSRASAGLLLGLAMAATLLAAPRGARAGTVDVGGRQFRYDVTESLLVEDHDEVPCFAHGRLTLCDSGDKATKFFQDAFEKLDADIALGEWTAALRIDAAVFANTPINHNPAFAGQFDGRYQNDARLEKLYAAYHGRNLELTLGDSYVQFGSGIALSLRKIDELSQDTTLRGAKLELHEGAFGLTAVAGITNTTNVDQVTDYFAPDPNDLILGARGEVRLDSLGGLLLGVHGVQSVMRENAAGTPCVGRFAPLSPDQPGCPRTSWLGATAELPQTSFGLRLYAEGDVRLASLPGSHVARGEAAYVAATESRGPGVGLLELKVYRDLDPYLYASSDSGMQPLQVYYSAPPSLERPLAEVLDEADVWGPHARVDLSVTPNVLVYASTALFFDDYEPEVPPHGHRHDIFDPYAGVQAFWDGGESHAFLSGGDRYDRFDLDGTEFNQDLHFEYNIEEAVDLPYSIALEGEHHYRTQLTNVLQHWVEGDVALSLKHSPTWYVSVGYEYTTQGLPLPNLGLKTASYPVKSLPNVSGTWNVTPSSSIGLFVGGSRGGLRCYNVCRVYPPFLGAKAYAVIRF